MRRLGARPSVLCEKVPLKLDGSLLGGYTHPGRSGPSMEEPVSPWEGVFICEK